jgi:hypothetical protein
MDLRQTDECDKFYPILRLSVTMVARWLRMPAAVGGEEWTCDRQTNAIILSNSSVRWWLDGCDAAGGCRRCVKHGIATDRRMR